MKTKLFISKNTLNRFKEFSIQKGFEISFGDFTFSVSSDFSYLLAKRDCWNIETGIRVNIKKKLFYSVLEVNCEENCPQGIKTKILEVLVQLNTILVELDILGQLNF